jgi:hypothetical protein
MSNEKLKNYRAVNTITGCNCGHKHHSRETALGCGEAMGWTGIMMAERFDSSSEGFGKRSIHHNNRKKIYDLEEAKYAYPELYY